MKEEACVSVWAWVWVLARAWSVKYQYKSSLSVGRRYNSTHYIKKEDNKGKKNEKERGGNAAKDQVKRESRVEKWLVGKEGRRGMRAEREREKWENGERGREGEEEGKRRQRQRKRGKRRGGHEWGEGGGNEARGASLPYGKGREAGERGERKGGRGGWARRNKREGVTEEGRGGSGEERLHIRIDWISPSPPPPPPLSPALTPSCWRVAQNVSYSCCDMWQTCYYAGDFQKKTYFTTVP